MNETTTKSLLQAFERAEKSIERLERENFILDKQLEMKNNHLSVILDNAPVILFGIDKNGTFELALGKGLEKMDLEPGRLVGKSIHHIYRTTPHLLVYFEKALSGETVTFELKHTQHVCFLVRLVPELDENGEVFRVYGISTQFLLTQG